MAIDEVSFDVHDGEIFGLIGPNGAGKTTTMECVEGLRSPDRGTISILGLDPFRDVYKLQNRIGVQPVVSFSAALLVSTLSILSIGFLIASAVPTARKDKFGLGFQIAATDGTSTRERGAGSYTWAGINNTHFWVDPKNGIGAVILTQVLPFYYPVSMDVLKRFEKLIYEYLQ